MKNYQCRQCQHQLCAKKVPIFSFLSDKELHEIVHMTGHKQFSKGEAICIEGDLSDTLYILNEGKVKLTKLTKDGKEQIVHILSEGDFFGELNIFSENRRYNFSAYAITSVRICTLTKVDMDKILLQNPQISIKIIKEMTKKLYETENLAQTLATNNAEVRIAYMIYEFGEKYGEKTSDGVNIKFPLNREEMANYTGVTRETISRKLKLFSKLGMIKLIGNKIIVIKDEQLLLDYIK